MNNEQQKLPILVTGAAGRIGSVGRKVTELLLARGFRVRAQVRVDDERAAELRRVEFDRSDLYKATRSCSIISAWDQL
jgi:nucleoside-diphosphate-sugar epimerase